MTVLCAYRFGAEILTVPDARSVGTVDLPPLDWGPALQWAHWQNVRQARPGDGPLVMRSVAGRVEPCWDAEAGRPFVSSLEVRSDGPGGAADIPTRYARSAVEAAAVALVGEGALGAGDPFLFRLFAIPDERPVHAGTSPPADFEPLLDPLPLREASLAAATTGAVGVDASFSDPVDVPVLIPAAVLEEATEAAAANREMETGGVLIGHLCVDPSSREFFVEVTAQLPARHAVATVDRLTFTAQTWADAHASLSLRGRGEMHLGWVHSHPWPCGSCAPDAQQRCPRSAPFLSVHDHTLHRTIFGRAFDIALLVADRGPRGFELALYGWRRGLLERRSYRVTGPGAERFATPSGARMLPAAQPPAPCALPDGDTVPAPREAARTLQTVRP